MQSTAINTPIFGGDNQETVLAKLGQPLEVQVHENSTVLVYCNESGFVNHLLHVWVKDGIVRETKKTSNTEIGTCLDNNSQVNWASTEAIGSLVLGDPRASSSNEAIFNALQNSREQNNQIYNSLINNMGTQIQSLQPQRLQTNCMWIGKMLSCN